MSQLVSSTSRRRWARTPLKAVVAAFAVLATVVPVLIFSTAQPAAAAGAVTLSKTTGIAPAGETLTVDGSGFDSSGTKGIYVQFCKQIGTSGTASGRPSGANCSGAQKWIGPTAPPSSATWTGSGTFSTTIDVVPTWGTVDCRAAGTVCGVVTRNDHTDPGAYDQDSFTPVTFAPVPIVPAPVVTVSKTSAIEPSGESITVSGSGFDSNGGIYVMFCQQAAGTIGTPGGRATGAACNAAGQKWISTTSPPASATWTGTGTFSVPVDVKALIGTTDCRTVTCGIQTRRDHTAGTNYDSDTFTPIAFAADPLVPTVSVSKTSAITAAGESITVSGSGFDSTGGIYVMFCQQAAGTIGTPGGRATGAACNAAGQKWISTTSPPASATWTGTGTFSVPVDVKALIGTTDCRTVTCGIQTRRDHTAGTNYDSDTFTPITFAADPPVEPTGPTVTVTPTAGLDGAADTVTVEGQGFPEDQGVYVRFCQAPTGASGTAAGRPAAATCDVPADLWVTPAPPVGGPPASMVEGAFSVELDVVGRFAGESSVIECMAADACGVSIRRDHVGGATDYALDSFTGVAFDPTSTPPVVEEPEEPTLNTVELALSKTADVADGETLTATGSGFTAEQGIYVQYCEKPTGQLGTAAGRAARCFPGQDGTHTVWVTPIAANGEFTSPVVVEKSFELADGEVVDCSTAGACGVFVRRDHNGGATDYSQDAFVAITFGDGEAPPATEASLVSDKISDLDPDGDTLAIEGADFRPGVDYYVALCAADDLLSCDYDQAEQVTSATATTANAATRALGDPGTFAVDLDVRAAFDGVDCLATDCVVTTFAVSLSEEADEVVLPVSFAARAGGGPGTTAPISGNGISGNDGSTGTTVTAALPRTGSSVLPVALAGLATVLVGAGLVVGTRRRTAQA